MDISSFFLAILAGRVNRGDTLNVDPPIDNYEENDAGQPLYAAMAPRGTPTSASKWVIRKWNYNASGRYTGSTYAVNVAWDNRATETYS